MLLKDAALVMGITFDPLVIVSDFELAMVQASTMSFPNPYHIVAVTTTSCRLFGERYDQKCEVAHTMKIVF